jgi:hypothetical protein
MTIFLIGYVSSISYNCDLLTGMFKRGKIIKKKKKKEKVFNTKKNTEINNNFKSYFKAGGRHQTMVNGEIVCEYLQSCTDAKLLNDNQYAHMLLYLSTSRVLLC